MLTMLLNACLMPVSASTTNLQPNAIKHESEVRRPAIYTAVKN